MEYNNLKKELQEVYNQIKIRKGFEYIIVVPSSKYKILEDSINKDSPKVGHQIYGIPIIEDVYLKDEFKIYERKINKKNINYL
jgi:hypothetical protein